ncbi:serine-rich adhesin for platelets-like [Odontomachus brunneus]|uniref:serine-rich adhesin for platelets-like n=1 Tax=Odontomachus brunneus TaxID=486640 RepID=UPI0013F24D9C|nr:serine-rich adhesin for platelets-like [Odontomachus brunneus]
MLRDCSNPRLPNRVCSSKGRDAMSESRVGRDINGRCFVSPQDRNAGLGFTSVARGPLFSARWGNRYRGRNAVVNAPSRNVSADQRAKLGADRKRSASVGTSSREIQSSRDENSVKCSSMRSQGPREQFLSSRKKSNTKREMLVKKYAKTSKYKGRLFTDETSDVASASNDDPIYNLRKEIRDWRTSGQLNEFQREYLIIEDGTKKNVLRVDHGQGISKDPADPDVLSESPSSIVTDRLTRRTENLSSLESCNGRICSATSRGEMTSARTCYCKQKGCVEDNDIRARRENRRAATVASRKSIVKSVSSGGSSRTARSVPRVDERKSETSRSVEARARDPVLSPETSTALENAERIINDAKIQLAKVHVVPGLDSARRDRDTFADDPPLDDEVEELLYIRELVTSKFQETSYPGRPEASSEENASRITTRRVDLSAPKFRTSQRRRVAVRTSLECGTDEQRSRGRAPLAEAPENSKDSSSKDDQTTARDSQPARSRRRPSSAARVVQPDSGVCRIQIGPPLHVNGELTRQDLEDVHISPRPSPARRRVNAATYILHHESATEESSMSVDNEANKSLMTSRARRRARLATLSREKREKPIATEVVVETATTSASRKLEEDVRVVVENQDSDYERNNEQKRAPTTPQLQDGAYREEEKDKEVNLRDAKISERSMANVTNEEATDTVGKPDMNFGNNVENRRTDDEGKFNEKSCVDNLSRLQNVEYIADKIQAENRGDQSQPPLASTDVSRRVSFPRENIARPCRTTSSSKQYRAIDEYLSNMFNRESHDEADEPYDDVAEKIRSSWDDFSAKDEVNEVELYRPRLDELDSTLLSNDKKIERAVRAVQTFAALLTKPEFARYKIEERKRETSRDNLSTTDLSGDHGRGNSLDQPTTSPSVVATISKNETPSISSASEIQRVSVADSQEASAAATKTKSLGFMKRNVRRRDDHSQNSVESAERAIPDASDDSKMSPDEDGAQRPKSKTRLSELSMDKSDITTFSSLPPALSSTRTDTQIHRLRQDRVAQAKSQASEDNYADSKSRVTNRFEDSANKTDRTKEGCNDVFAQILRSLKDETTDRLVAYMLQDERHIIEGKVAKVLDESAVAPTMMEKLFARLQETDSVGDVATRRTETLDVLKDILINVKSQTDGAVDGEAMEKEKETEEINSHKVSPRAIEELALHEKNGQQTQVRVASDENGRLIEDSRDLGSRDERSEARESATHTIPGSRSNGESKRDLHSEGESLKRISDILSDEAGNPRENSRLSPAKTVSVRSQKDQETEADGPDAATITFHDERSNMSGKRHEYRSSGIKDDKDSVLGDQHTNESISRTTTDQVNDGLLGATDGTLVVAKEKEEKKEEKTEITAEKAANDSTALKDKEISSPPASDVSGKRDKRTQSDASRPRVVDETLAKEDLAHSLTEENIRSSCAQAEQGINNTRANSAANGKISPADSCSADSLRDCASLHTLSSAQSDESPLKEVQSCDRRISLVVVDEANSTKASNEDGNEPVTNGTPKSRGNGNKESVLPKSTRSSGNEQLWLVASTLRMSLSSSSVSSATLDHNGGSNNVAFGDDTKREIGTSSEMSHSEGELYMPSSCSYSLGEVRILEKGDLITDSTIERDSSVTIFVTKSMLTPLSDTSTLLGSSGRV